MIIHLNFFCGNMGSFVLIWAVPILGNMDSAHNTLIIFIWKKAC
jgi:hypothetical protein